MASLTDKLMIGPALGLILGKTLVGTAAAPFRGAEGAPTFGEHVRNTLLRNLIHTLTIEQMQWITPSFVDAYKSWCSKNKLSPDVVTLANTKPEAQGFWIGDKAKAKYAMVFFHGGGFALAGTDMHVDMVHRMVKWSNGSLAAFCVAYTLSLHADYPVAIGQCVEGLRHVLQDRSPDTVLLGGDSAGGNLSLAVLSHISGHPHPQSNIVRPLDVQGSLNGAILIAPWVSDREYPSVKKYKDRDFVSKNMSDYWAEAYKGRGKNIPEDEFLWPLSADPQWWKQIKCSKMLVTAGEEESLRDAIVAFCEKFQAGNTSCQFKFVIGLREVHDTPLNGYSEGYLDKMGEKTQEGAIRAWIKENLK